MSEYTNEAKAKKFDEMLAEYNRLQLYRHNLTITVIGNIESIMEERPIKQGEAFLLLQVDKKLDPQKMIAIQQEIVRIDTIISFINTIVYGDERITFDSTINPPKINESTRPNTEPT